MPGYQPLKWNAEALQQGSGLRFAPRSFLLALLSMIIVSSFAEAQRLPPGGTTSWEIQGPEEIVTFVLFDPKKPGVSLPTGLRFVSAQKHRCPKFRST